MGQCTEGTCSGGFYDAMVFCINCRCSYTFATRCLFLTATSIAVAGIYCMYQTRSNHLAILSTAVAVIDGMYVSTFLQSSDHISSAVVVICTNLPPNICAYINCRCSYRLYVSTFLQSSDHISIVVAIIDLCFNLPQITRPYINCSCIKRLYVSTFLHLSDLISMAVAVKVVCINLPQIILQLQLQIVLST